MDEIKLDDFVENETKVDVAGDAPSMESPEWNDYVMGLFQPSELFNGLPKVNGLRRVVTKLFGPIGKNLAEIVDVPRDTNGHRATAKCFIQVGNRVIQSVADAADDNMNNFQQYKVAIAGTRAEAIALRKLLQIETIAAEEGMDTNAIQESEFIKPAQIKAMDRQCKEQNINVLEFINAGRKKYKTIKEVPFNKAKEMLNALTEYGAKGTKPEKLVEDYNPVWQEN